MHATYLPSSDVVYQWRCSECRNAWQTSLYAAISADSRSNQSLHLRENAGHCLSLEHSAPDDLARSQFKRLGDSWRALAETQDWLDGVTPPVARPLPQERAGLISSIPRASRGRLA